MMEKIDVNGLNTHNVYKFLKSHANGPFQIRWNFNTYFIIDSHGEAYEYTGIRPQQLRIDIEESFDEEL